MSERRASAIPGPRPTRLHALDTVRGGALLLGIFFHASVSFLPGDAPMWLVMDTERSVTMSVIFYVLHIFRMATFFVIAGYFGRMSYHRLGAGAFIRDRLKRIAIPLTLFWPIMMVAFTALIVWSVIVQHGALPDEPAPAPHFDIHTVPLTHLWFLYVLVLFYGAVLLVRLPFLALDSSGRIRAALDHVVAGVLWSPLGIVVLAAPTAVALYSMESWMVWFGTPTPDRGLFPNFGALVAYGTAFGFGWLLHRQSVLLTWIERAWWIYAGFAFVATLHCLCLVGLEPNPAVDLSPVYKAAYAASYSLAMWAWTFAVVGVALRFFSNENPTRRYIADSSYWLYLIHLPIVVGLQILVSQWPWPWVAKYVLVVGVSTPVMILSYRYMVRGTFIGALLNGRRRSA